MKPIFSIIQQLDYQIKKGAPAQFELSLREFKKLLFELSLKNPSNDSNLEFNVYVSEHVHNFFAHLETKPALIPRQFNWGSLASNHYDAKGFDDVLLDVAERMYQECRNPGSDEDIYVTYLYRKVPLHIVGT